MKIGSTFILHPSSFILCFTTEVCGLDAHLTIQAIGCTLQLSEVYDGVVFPADNPPLTEADLAET